MTPNSLAQAEMAWYQAHPYAPREILMETTATRRIRSALTSYLDQSYKAAEAKGLTDPKKGPQHKYIRHVNREADRLLRAFRLVAKELTRELPGRMQRGAIDAAINKVAPIITDTLK